MSKGWYVDCANCGKEVLIDGSEDNCYLCGKNASKKEFVMAEKEATVEERVVPPRPKKRKKVWEYYEQNKEAMIADYQSMRVSSFFVRWTITSGTWQKLKRQWGVPNKQKGAKPMKRPSAGDIQRKEYKEPQPELGEFCILITETDLAKLDDDDYRLQWVLLGRIIRNRIVDKS